MAPLKWHKHIPEGGISLGVADIDFEGPPGTVDYLKSKLTDDFSFYQAQSGLPSTISSVKDFLFKKKIPVNETSIQIIEGTMMGISIAMRWISKVEGNILVANPIYEPIHRHGSDHGNSVTWTRLTPHGLDIDDLHSKISSRTKMIVFCNPSNPTGHVYTKEELKVIRDLVLDHDLYVFCDELYEPLQFGVGHRSIASFSDITDRCLLLYGFSKAYGLAGYRAGFMYIGPEIEDIKFMANQQMVSPSPIASLVTEYALTSTAVASWVEEFVNQMKLNTEFAVELLKEHGIDCHVPNGCFFVFPHIGIDDTEFESYLLDKYGVQIVAGSRFGPAGKNYIRINCATSKERLKEGIMLIIQGIAAFKTT